MTAAWRLVKKTRANEAFSGEGARSYGGRWNHRGTAVAYVSGSLSLAALELFVHLGSAHKGLRFAAFKVEIPRGVEIDELSPADLPRSWREEPPPDACKSIGTAWVDGSRTAVLRVPSVVVPMKHNYVLNVGHPDFEKLEVSKHPDFSFDPRMWK